MSGRRIESFLLRLVVNETQGMELEIGDWRGRIQHIGSGHERYFEHLEDIVAFINEQFSGGYRVLQSEKETQNTL
jgi:hypothetical protein